jgi:hypothetical protein
MTDYAITTDASRPAGLATTAQPLTRLGGFVFPSKGTVAAQLLTRAAAANRGSGKNGAATLYYHKGKEDSWVASTRHTYAFTSHAGR